MSILSTVCPRRNLSIRVRLLLLMAVVIVPAIGLLAWHIADEAQQAREDAYAQVKIIADDVAADLALTLRDNEELIKRIAAEYRGNPPMQAAGFSPDQFMRMHPQLVNLGVRDLHANLIFSQLPNPVSADQELKFPWGQQGLRSESFVAGDAFFGSLSGRWVTMLTYPVRGDDGQRSGFVNMPLDLLALNQRVMSAVPKNAVVSVSGAQGKLLLRSVDPQAWLGKSIPVNSSQQRAGRHEGFMSNKGLDGITRLNAFVKVPGSDWLVVAGLPEDEVLAGYRQALIGGIGGGSVALLLLVALAWWLAERIARPIRELAATAGEVAGGDTAARAHIAGPAEVAEVARQFNQMLDIADRSRLSLMRAAEELQASEQHYRLLIEKSLAGVYVSRDGFFLYANPRMEEILGYGPGELIGMRIDDMLLAEDLPLLQAARAQLRVDAPVATFSGRLRRKDGTIVELGVQGILAKYDGETAVIGMAQDIGERNRAQAEIKHYITRLEHSTESTLQAVALMVEQRDPYTAGHERRVGDLAAAIGAELGLPSKTVKGLRLTGCVHDIGKISVPAELLSKPAKLSPLEFELIKVHAQAGHDILKDVDFPWPLAEVILQHHERLDGSGYPRSLKGEAIIAEARIMAVADVVEAMSSHRPYRPGRGMEAALDEIEKNSGTFYDPQVVEACLRLFREKGYTLPD